MGGSYDHNASVGSLPPGDRASPSVGLGSEKIAPARCTLKGFLTLVDVARGLMEAEELAHCGQLVCTK